MFGSCGSIGLRADISQCLKNAWFRCQMVQCLHVGNAEIPDNKRLEFALQHIHGISRQKARQILVDLRIDNKFTKDLTGLELHSLREEVSKYMIGEDLKRCVRGDVKRLIDIQCYRGFNHVCLLPCRGQRTSTNAQTRKGQRELDRSSWGQYLSLAEGIQRRQERSHGK